MAVRSPRRWEGDDLGRRQEPFWVPLPIEGDDGPDMAAYRFSVHDAIAAGLAHRERPQGEGLAPQPAVQ
jgi:hypothetical protein